MVKKNNNTEKAKIGIVMMGGGARAAYQVGVLRAIVDMRPKNSPSPFDIISGTSAGAINAVSLACAASNYQLAVMRINHVWRNFQIDHVFRGDMRGIFLTILKWMGIKIFSFSKTSNPLYLLDRKPLSELLNKHLKFDDIQKSIDNGHIQAISVTASGYTSGQSVTFYQAAHGIKRWVRSRRVGCRENITLAHLMASSAIPLMFAPVRINREFFGDGSMRQMAPLSAALHLGSDRILVIGNRDELVEPSNRDDNAEKPSLSQIAGHVMNSIFLDSLEADIERLERINKTVSLIPDSILKQKDIGLRKVESLLISPSEDLGDMAQPYVSKLPFTLRLLLGNVGSKKDQGSSLVSYLMFQKDYCRSLIRLGYKDAMAQRDKIEYLLRDGD
ncbi:Patatin [hydrothermal vent metagenome]|uniref:Patatin n=1 Tax=hydrothermal vent metagenome TaxID=652676 RepID=A0A3B1AGN3_9ZZZZ